jgi:hypothetical protein
VRGAARPDELMRVAFDVMRTVVDIDPRRCSKELLPRPLGHKTGSSEPLA